jgi:hypothetical protein
MALNKDWREFLELLNSRGVDYVIVGAQSLRFMGAHVTPVTWMLLFRPTLDNVQRLLGVLTRFGFA